MAEHVAPIDHYTLIDADLDGVGVTDNGLVVGGYGWAWGAMRSSVHSPVDATVTPAAFQQSLFFYATDPEMEGLLDLMAPTPTKKVTISF